MLPAFRGENYRKPLREATVCVSQEARDFSIRQGPWKLILKPGPKPEKELYHLGEDPAESRVRAAEQPQVVERLTKLLEKYRAEGRSRP